MLPLRVETWSGRSNVMSSCLVSFLCPKNFVPPWNNLKFGETRNHFHIKSWLKPLNEIGRSFGHWGQDSMKSSFSPQYKHVPVTVLLLLSSRDKWDLRIASVQHLIHHTRSLSMFSESGSYPQWSLTGTISLSEAVLMNVVVHPNTHRIKWVKVIRQYLSS